METETKTQTEKRNDYLKAIVVDPKRMSGRWELRIIISNSQGIKAFGGRLLTSYTHPLTGLDTPLVNLNSQRELGFMISRPSHVFSPDTNQMDRRIVDWLLSHPEVAVEGVELLNSITSKKDSNPKIFLKNLDRQEMSDIEDEDTIDLVIGRLSEDGVKGISLERLRYLLSHFNLPYFDRRYISNKTVEKKFLRKKIKTFARGKSADGELNATKITAVLDNVDNLKYSYEFKEMLRVGVIKESYGSYKFNNVPLGSNEDSVITWLKNNLEIYSEMTGVLYPILKEEGFEFKK